MEEEDYKLDGHKLWRKAMMSGRYIRPEDSVPADIVGEMEMAGIVRGTANNGGIYNVGAISAITEIFSTDGRVVAKYTPSSKSELAGTLTTALHSYVKFCVGTRQKLCHKV